MISVEGSEEQEKRITLEENGLRRVEADLLAKEDFALPEERQQVLNEFYSLAARLRQVHQQERMQKTQLN